MGPSGSERLRAPARTGERSPADVTRAAGQADEQPEPLPLREGRPGRGPLEGVRVADFGIYVAGAGAGLVLAQLGADVIKIEPVTGELARHNGAFGQALIREYNRGKRSLALDLQSEAGADVAWRLIGTSDVVIQNMRPGVMDRLGFGPQAVLSRHPELIYLSISGFGEHGPSKSRPGLDIAAQAESGLMSVTGAADGPPERVGTAIVDAATTHMAAESVLAALIGRARTGMGQLVEISLLEVAIALQGVRLSEYFLSGKLPTRGEPPTVAPAAEVLRTKDGYIVLSAYADDHWRRLCGVLGCPEAAEEERFRNNAARVAHRDEIRVLLESKLSTYSSAAAVEFLSCSGVVAGEVRDYEGVLHSSDVQATGVIGHTSGPSEPYQALNLPYRMPLLDQQPLTSAPDVGANSAELLAELGYDVNEAAAILARQSTKARD